MEIARASDFLLVDPVKAICENFILSNISVENCFQIKQFSYEVGSSEISAAVDDFVLNHFYDVYANQDIGIYEFEEYRSLIRNDRLYVKREIDVFHSLIKWINYDFDERFELLPLFLSECVRFVFISNEEIDNISLNEYVKVSCLLNHKYYTYKCFPKIKGKP